MAEDQPRYTLYLTAKLSAEFRPVFKVVDAVTDTATVYSGPYTLRALAGGIQLSNMREFMPREHVYVALIQISVCRLCSYSIEMWLASQLSQGINISCSIIGHWMVTWSICRYIQALVRSTWYTNCNTEEHGRLDYSISAESWVYGHLWTALRKKLLQSITMATMQSSTYITQMAVGWLLYLWSMTSLLYSWGYFSGSRDCVSVCHCWTSPGMCRWVCGTSSPCGEILPKNSKTSEYFLLLEASNLWVRCYETSY